MATRAHFTIVLAVVVAAAAATLVLTQWTGCTPAPAPPPTAEAYLGLTEAQILERLGPPGDSTEGSFEKVPLEYLKLHPTARTHRYSYQTGTLHVSVELVGENWVCFDSDWVPAAAAAH